MRLHSAIAAVLCVVATPTHAGAQTAPGGGAGADEGDIVVTAQARPRGTIPGASMPEVTLSGGEARASGATSIAELVATLAPSLGTVRGRDGGGPVFLLNGRRIADYSEISSLPAEAVQRVEVFAEDVALQYGYPADQRVVNVVLRRRYKATTAEGALGQAAEEARTFQDAKLGYLRLTQTGRLQLDFNAASQSAITEAEGGIAPPSAGLDDRAQRTLAPDSRSGVFTGVYSQNLTNKLLARFSLHGQSRDTEGLLGVDAGGQTIRSDAHSSSQRFSATLDRATKDWNWTLTGSTQRSFSDNSVLRPAPALDSRSQSVNWRSEGAFNVSGPLFELPAGSMRFSGKAALSNETLETFSRRAGLTTDTGLDRLMGAVNASLSAPLTNQNNGTVGAVSLNVSGAHANLSDFHAVTSYGAGGNWSPLRSLRFSAQASWAETAPTLQQLGAPLLTIPSSSIYDPLRGEDVEASVTSGGNPGLRAEKRRDLTLNASWTPQKMTGLTFSAAYARNHTVDALSSFPQLSAALEAGFPGRFVRDGSGALIAVDRRPINLAERNTQSVRLGFTLSRRFGPKLAPPWGSGPPPWTQPQQGADPGVKPWQPPPGFFPDPQAPAGQTSGGGGGGFGRNATAGRYSASVFYSRRIEDKVVLGAGGAELDLLDGDTVVDAAGAGPDKIEFDGGVNWRGVGLRASGVWNSGYELLGATAAQDLSFSGYTSLNLRAFIGFDQRPVLVRDHPWLRGLRVTARFENVLNAAPKATDASGATPYSYQKAYLAPQGRVASIALRKQF
jgi:hypothetical protein